MVSTSIVCVFSSACENMAHMMNGIWIVISYLTPSEAQISAYPLNKIGAQHRDITA